MRRAAGDSFNRGRLLLAVQAAAGEELAIPVCSEPPPNVWTTSITLAGGASSGRGLSMMARRCGGNRTFVVGGRVEAGGCLFVG
jgi:hypothetical protein